MVYTGSVAIGRAAPHVLRLLLVVCVEFQNHQDLVPHGVVEAGDISAERTDATAPQICFYSIEQGTANFY